MTKIEQEKSLALAELMGWRTYRYTCLIGDVYGIDLGGESGFVNGYMLKPYTSDLHGYAQFAAILLRFPKVIDEFFIHQDEWQTPRAGIGYVSLAPNQANILDEILKMEGKWLEAWDE